MSEVSADLTSEILTKRCSGKKVFRNWQSEFLKEISLFQIAGSYQKTLWKTRCF